MTHSQITNDMPLQGVNPEPCGGAIKFTKPTPTPLAKAGGTKKASGTTARYGMTRDMIADTDNRLTMANRRKRLMAVSFKGTLDVASEKGTKKAVLDAAKDVIDAAKGVRRVPDVVTAHIFKNGSLLEGASHAVKVKAGSPEAVSMDILTELVVGDYLEMYVSNTGSGADVTLTGQLQVIG